jgi:glutamate--cysteine ligase
MTERLHRDALLETYHSYGCAEDQWRVGAELERHLLGPAGQPMVYEGPRGIAWLLQALTTRGWTPKYEGDNLIALARDGATVTLEPGAQFELSGKPHHSLLALRDEAAVFAREVDEILAETDVRQVALGYTPFADVEAIPWVPKGRYAVMRAHMQQAGTLGHHMMKGTAATQASFDFSNEADAARKVQAAMRLAPIVTATFANAPLTLGKPNGWQSFRAYIWTQTDPARCGFPEAATAFTFERWVDYLLDVPMMFLHQDGQWRAARGQTFRQWMTSGDEAGRFPTWADWDLHQTAVFPEVRVKHLIEMRMADCVGTDEVAAFSALWKGLLYGASHDALETLCTTFTAEGSSQERFLTAARDGLRGRASGRTLAAWADEAFDLARVGLERIAPGEGPLLDAVWARVQRAETPADQLLACFARNPSVASIRAFTHPCGSHA